MKRLLQLVTVLMTFALGACTYITEPVTPQSTKADTTAKIVLPPFPGIGNYLFVPSEQVYEMQLWFYGPMGFHVDATASSDNPAVVVVDSYSLSQNVSFGDNQIHWLASIRIKVIGLGTGKVTLKLTNVPNQSSSFGVEGIVPPGGKG